MFWRRGGSRFDYGGNNSLTAWVVRVLVVVFVVAAIILIARLWIERRGETVAVNTDGGVGSANVLLDMERVWK